MKKTRHLDHDGLDGIVPSTNKAQPKEDNPQANADKPQPKAGQNKVIWLATGLALVLGVVVLKLPVQQESPATNTLAANQSPSLPATSAQPAVLKQNQAIPPAEKPAANQLADATATDQDAIDKQQAESKILAELPTEPTAAGVKNVGVAANAAPLFTAYFEYDSKKPIALTDQESGAFAAAIAGCANQIKLTGHTCNLGGPIGNQHLGLARAKAVQKLLITKGVDAKRIVIASEGMANPLASNDTKAGQAQNRRVELTCLDN